MRHLNPFDESVYRPAKPLGLEHWTPPPSPALSAKSEEEIKEEEERRESEKEKAREKGEWPWCVPKSPKWREQEVDDEDQTVRSPPLVTTSASASAITPASHQGAVRTGEDDEDKTTVTTILALAAHYPELPDTDPLDDASVSFDEPRSHFSDDSEDDDNEDFYDANNYDSGDEGAGNSSGFTFANDDTLLSDDENDDSRTLPPPTPLRHGHGHGSSDTESDSDIDSDSDSDGWGDKEGSGDEGFFDARGDESGEDSYDEDEQEGNLQEGYTYHRGEYSWTHRGGSAF